MTPYLNVLCLLLQASLSDEPVNALNDERKASAPSATQAHSEASAASFDFNLIPPDPTTKPPTVALSPDILKKSVAKRRWMLNTHQVLGLTTLGLMATTVVLGQLNYSDLYGKNGGHSGNYLVPHMIGAYATTGSFIATASFSLFAPSPYHKAHQGIDTSIVHKASVGVAAAGMVTQIVLGFITARSADAGNHDHLGQWARVHQAIGYTTLGAMTAAAVVWVF